jgi:hypothetical protein
LPLGFWFENTISCIMDDSNEGMTPKSLRKHMRKLMQQEADGNRHQAQSAASATLATPVSMSKAEPRLGPPIICKPPHYNQPPRTHHRGWRSESSPLRTIGTMAPQVAFQATGPHPSYIHVAEQFTFQQKLQNQLIAIGTNPTREDNFRLQGVQWINDVRTALQL